MLCTFTTETGKTLIIRSDDIRVIEDSISDGLADLTYMVGETTSDCRVQGTALENAARISQEELDMIGRVELHRYKTQQLMAAQPVPRGRQAS